MHFDEAIVFLIVAAAAAYLARRAIRRRQEPGCGGCGSCPGAGAAPKPEPAGGSDLIQLELTPRKSVRRG
jgi:hypothetical protein